MNVSKRMQKGQMQLQTQIGTPYYMAPGSINDILHTVVPLEGLISSLISSLIMTRIAMIKLLLRS
jgi:hypothetical protein